MADAMASATVGPRARFFSRERVDEIVLLLREAEKHSTEGVGGAWQLIDTAPKDDSVLVALIRDGVIWRVSEARHNGVGWYTKSGESCHWRTHWAPMPGTGAPSSIIDVTEMETIARCVDHWFTQGGEAKFGTITASNPDELISAILTRVRASQWDHLLAFVLATVNAVGDSVSKQEAGDAIEREWQKVWS